MKMSEFANNILDKKMLIELIKHLPSCEACPFQKACEKAVIDNPDESCEQFLNRWIEDDRNEC